VGASTSHDPVISSEAGNAATAALNWDKKRLHRNQYRFRKCLNVCTWRTAVTFWGEKISNTFKWSVTENYKMEDDFCVRNFWLYILAIYTKLANKIIYYEITHNSNGILIIYELAFPFH
jgi:hypothetical protein